MEREKFVLARKNLGKTQKQLAELLGISLKAIHSYEQGWRSIPVYVERQLFFLIAIKGVENQIPELCWVIKKCPPHRKERCPAWEFKEGRFCWFINGTICEGKVCKNWDEKMEICQSCEVLFSDVRSFLIES